MKTKKIDKKLALNKKTVANLGTETMRDVRGGFLTYEMTICRSNCVSNCPICQSRIPGCYGDTDYECNSYTCWTDCVSCVCE